MNQSLTHCPKCKSTHLVKAGFAYGKQRHRCKECNHYFTVMRKSTKKSDETKQMAIKMYLEGLGFRAIGRLLNISHQTAYRWVRQAGEQHQIQLDNSQDINIVELDEIHSYIKHKKTIAGLGLPLTETQNTF